MADRTGLTKDAGYQIGVSRTVDAALGQGGEARRLHDYR